MELESVVHHWTHSISDRDYVERCQLNDLKYNMLAPGVWYDCECSAAAKAGGAGRVRAQFTGGLCRCKNFSASYPWSPPLGHTAEEVRDGCLDVCLILSHVCLLFGYFVYFLDYW